MDVADSLSSYSFVAVPVDLATDFDLWPVICAEVVAVVAVVAVADDAVVVAEPSVDFRFATLNFRNLT